VSPAAVRNILSFDVEDWHQSTFDARLPITARVPGATSRILDLCAAAGARGTFFVLGLVARAYPDLVRRIRDAGHEVALHGLAHAPVHAMTPDAFRADVRESRDLVEQAAGVSVAGYRAPDFSITRPSLWALQVLAEEGFLYDSSVFPFDGPRYGIAESFPLPYRVLCPGAELVEFPLATTRLLGRPLPAAGGGYFRLFPYAWHRRAVRRINGLGSPAMTYFHPYEIDAEEIPRSPHRIPLSLRLSQGRAAARASGARILLGDRPRPRARRRRPPDLGTAPRPAHLARRPRPVGHRPGRALAGGVRTPPLESRPCAGFPGS
jgi:polysaccharide deacetylase family protein (PEP-CTERM system associated)